jgi:hypothetical protein
MARMFITSTFDIDIPISNTPSAVRIPMPP